MQEHREQQGDAKILVLEDDDAQRETLTSILTEEGFDVCACSQAAEAFAQLRIGNTDVAIVDLCLPDISTKELLIQLQPYSDHVAIIINTAFSSLDTAKNAVNLGAVGYIEKAGDPECLVRQVHRAFQTRLRQYAGQLEQAVAVRTRELQQANEDLRQSERKLKSLASELTLTEERLRRDIATQLHDTISQTLAMAKVEVASLREAVSDTQMRVRLAHILDSLDQALNDSRSLTSQLSHPILHVLGFEKALDKWVDEEARVKCGLHTVFETDSQDKPLDEDVSAVLFRGVRELLMNVVKHAQASSIYVSIARQKDQIVVALRDDGNGFKAQEVMSQTDGFGLLSIQEALNRLGGRLIIESVPKAGCTATMTAPLKVKEHTEVG